MDLWRYQRGKVRYFWDLWFFGNETANIRPYRSISKEHDIKAADKMHYCRAVTSQHILYYCTYYSVSLICTVHTVTSHVFPVSHVEVTSSTLTAHHSHLEYIQVFFHTSDSHSLILKLCESDVWRNTWIYSKCEWWIVNVEDVTSTWETEKTCDVTVCTVHVSDTE